MTIDARTASPEPSLHAATLLSRTRLTQLECAARLGISERTLRYHLTGRPMSYALRCLFESLAWECEMQRVMSTPPPWAGSWLGGVTERFVYAGSATGRTVTKPSAPLLARHDPDSHRYVDCKPEDEGAMRFFGPSMPEEGRWMRLAKS